jgi:hypothetical protein
MEAVKVLYNNVMEKLVATSAVEPPLIIQEFFNPTLKNQILITQRYER